ncbi:MAG: beta-propeller fold lactonase family protein [Acidobacteria bacterium]|nr:beta-propeller fold lactonase family protein [Acidobacteriota bacterium]
MPRSQVRGLTFALLIVTLFLGGCSNDPSAPAAVSVSVTPTTVSVQTGLTQQFTATVTNTSNTAVTWQVNGVTGGDATNGTVSASGLYAAPATAPSPATVTVTAVSQADNTKSASSTVTVINPPPVSVVVAPQTASVVVGATQQFTATVTNASDTSVTWQVNGVTGGDATHGTVSGTGLYTAPVGVPSPADVTVTAVSVADPTKSDSATVTVTSAPVITVTIAPKTASVAVTATKQFTATVTGTANTAVTWDVNGTAGGDATHGTISNTGLYTAPAAVPSPATVSVTATSVADNTKSDTATVTITSAPPANRFVYVGSFPDSTIKIFSVNDTTGLLTAAGGISTGANTNPGFLAMHPGGKFLYSLNRGAANIGIYSVNATTGALTAAGTAAADTDPFYMVFSPDGNFAYVTCDTASMLFAFSVNTTTGALTQVSGSPYAMGGGRVRGLAVTPNNKYLYVTDRDADNIQAFVIASGVLSPVAGSPFPAGTAVGTAVADSQSKYLYVGNRDDNNVGGYSINNSTGALTAINTYPSGGTQTSVWTFDPSGTHLYGGNAVSNDVLAFTINANGTLTAVAGMPFTTNTEPGGGGLHPNGKFAYVVNQVSEISVTPGAITIYSVDSTTGVLTQISSMASGSNNSAGFAITP